MMLIMKIPIVPRNNDNFVFVLLPQNIETRLPGRRRCTPTNGDNNGWWPMVYFAYCRRHSRGGRRFAF